MRARRRSSFARADLQLPVGRNQARQANVHGRRRPARLLRRSGGGERGRRPAHDRGVGRDPGGSRPRGAQSVKFAGMTAVITGGGQGIGAAIARALADGGASIIVAARNLDRVKAVAESIEQSGGKARAVRCDVTDPSSVHALASAASRQGAAVDILINNAGVAHSAPLHKITPDDWQRVFAVNATGTFLITPDEVARAVLALCDFTGKRPNGTAVTIAD